MILVYVKAIADKIYFKVKIIIRGNKTHYNEDKSFVLVG